MHLIIVLYIYSNCIPFKCPDIYVEAIFHLLPSMITGSCFNLMSKGRVSQVHVFMKAFVSALFNSGPKAFLLLVADKAILFLLDFGFHSFPRLVLDTLRIVSVFLRAYLIYFSGF